METGGRSHDTLGQATEARVAGAVPVSTRPPTWRELIDFEEHAPVGRRAKRNAIWREFKMLPGRYYLLLLRAVDRPDAMRYAPTTCAAIQRAREAGRMRRAIGGEAS